MISFLLIFGAFGACMLAIFGILVTGGLLERSDPIVIDSPDPIDLYLAELTHKYEQDEITLEELEKQSAAVLDGWVPEKDNAVKPYKLAPGVLVTRDNPVWRPTHVSGGAMGGTVHAEQTQCLGTALPPSYAYPLTPNGVRSVPDRNDLLMEAVNRGGSVAEMIADDSERDPNKLITAHLLAQAVGKRASEVEWMLSQRGIPWDWHSHTVRVGDLVDENLKNTVWA